MTSNETRVLIGISLIYSLSRHSSTSVADYETKSSKRSYFLHTIHDNWNKFSITYVANIHHQGIKYIFYEFDFFSKIRLMYFYSLFHERYSGIFSKVDPTLLKVVDACPVVMLSTWYTMIRLRAGLIMQI